MSGPLDCDDWNQFSRGNEERMYTMEDWDRFFWDLPMRGYPSWTTPPRDAAYGRSFFYCTAGVQIVGEALGRVLGEDLQAFAERELFAPVGIETHDWPRAGSGRMHLGGGLRLTTRGWAILGVAATQSRPSRRPAGVEPELDPRRRDAARRHGRAGL